MNTLPRWISALFLTVMTASQGCSQKSPNQEQLEEKISTHSQEPSEGNETLKQRPSKRPTLRVPKIKTAKMALLREPLNNVLVITGTVAQLNDGPPVKWDCKSP